MRSAFDSDQRTLCKSTYKETKQKTQLKQWEIAEESCEQDEQQQQQQTRAQDFYAFQFDFE